MLATLLVVAGAPVWSQVAGLSIQPRLSLTQTLTDNLRLSSDGRDAALITSLAPGISISRSSGRIKGSLDYAFNGLVYTKSRASSEVQNALSAKLNVEAVEGWIYLDSYATVSQQAVSAFGQQSSDPSLINDNRAEVASLGLTPSVRGQLAGMASYDLRATLSESSAKDSVAGDASSRNVSLSLTGLGGGKLLNWSAQASDQSSKARGGRDSEQTTVTATLLVTPDVDWNFGLTAGQERSDYTTASRSRSNSTYGANANWTPTPRTKVLADWRHHSYGDSHTLSLEHRMARSVWRISDSQSVTTDGVQGRGGAMTNYELFFLQYAGREPDPAKRDLLVRSLLDSLGLTPGGLINSGFLAAGPTLSRSQAISFSWQGLRSTVTAALNQGRSSSLGTRSPGQDDLSRSGLVRQRGFSVSLSHRLTPSDSATLVLSQQQSLGDQGSQRTNLKSLSANWNGRLGARTNLQLGLRHNRFDSQQQPYRESAVLATIVQQF